MSALTLPRQLHFFCHLFACVLQFLITQSYCSFFPPESTTSFSKLVATADFFLSSSLRAQFQTFHSNYPSLAQHTFSFFSPPSVFCGALTTSEHYIKQECECRVALTPSLGRAGVSGIQTLVVGTQAAGVIRCGECKTLPSGSCKDKALSREPCIPPAGLPRTRLLEGHKKIINFQVLLYNQV